AYVSPANPASIRRNPSTGATMEIDRLVIAAAPLASPQDVLGIATRSGGRVVGFVPMLNDYVLEFPQNVTFDGLNRLRQQLAAEPLVRAVSFGAYFHLASAPRTIDIFDRGGSFGNGAQARDAYDQIGLPGAIDLVRSTPPFTERDGFREVH